MKGLIACAGLVLALASGSAWAEGTPNGNGEIGPVIGVVKSGTYMGKTAGTYCMPPSDIFLDEGTPILLTGVETCNSYSSTYVAYEVAYRGGRYFVGPGDIEVKEEDVQRLKDMSSERLAEFKKVMVLYTAKKWLEAVDASQKALKKTEPNGITILDAGIHDVSEYTEGTGFSIKFFNPSKKRIKYVTVTFVGYNAVNDPVTDYRTGSKVKTFKAVGPIEPQAAASYSQDYAWMTDLVETFKITGIKVEYMDGSKKTVKDPSKARLKRADFAILSDYLSGDYSMEETEVAAREEERDEPRAPEPQE